MTSKNELGLEVAKVSQIKIENLSFSYYGYSNNIFNHVSFSFDTNWKTGLIGRNGIGKSTLFKLLLNEEKYQGTIFKSVDCLKFPPAIKDQTLTCLELFEVYRPNGETWRFLKELNLLGVDESLLHSQFCTLSKGEQTKMLLALLFTNENGFLLIDEPTNHLDLDGRKTVSAYLNNKKGFMLISHDRYFLDSCVDHVISINRNSIDVQRGNFTSWYENKRNKDQSEINENDRLKKDIKRLKEAAQQSKTWSDHVEKTKKGVKVSGVKPDKGRTGHQAAKMMKKSKNLENRQTKALEEKRRLLKDIEVQEDLTLRSLNHHKHLLIKIEKLSAFYGEKQVLNELYLDIKQGDRIALTGKNGSGKSTLLKILLGEKLNHTGEIAYATNLQTSYIPQDTGILKGNLKTYFKEKGVEETLCKTILRKLDFSRELFDLSMENYSDGQKRKVLLAVSLATPAHLFIWDEPLNYIDIISRMQIEDIIIHTHPTLIFVEHDQKFTENVANKVLAL